MINEIREVGEKDPLQAVALTKIALNDVFEVGWSVAQHAINAGAIVAEKMFSETILLALEAELAKNVPNIEKTYVENINKRMEIMKRKYDELDKDINNILSAVMSEIEKCVDEIIKLADRYSKPRNENTQ